MTETKVESIPIEDQESRCAEMAKEGWRAVAWGFAPEGGGHCQVTFEREKKPPKKPAKPKKK